MPPRKKLRTSTGGTMVVVPREPDVSSLEMQPGDGVVRGLECFAHVEDNANNLDVPDSEVEQQASDVPVGPDFSSSSSGRHAKAISPNDFQEMNEAASSQLRAEAADFHRHSTVGPPVKGKTSYLNSTNRPNRARKVSSPPVSGAQRKLGKTQQSRPSLYDDFNEASLRNGQSRRQMQQQAEVSPLREQKRQRKEQASQPQAAPHSMETHLQRAVQEPLSASVLRRSQRDSRQSISRESIPAQPNQHKDSRRDNKDDLSVDQPQSATCGAHRSTDMIESHSRKCRNQAEDIACGYGELLVPRAKVNPMHTRNSELGRGSPENSDDDSDELDNQERVVTRTRKRRPNSSRPPKASRKKVKTSPPELATEQRSFESNSASGPEDGALVSDGLIGQWGCIQQLRTRAENVEEQYSADIDLEDNDVKHILKLIKKFRLAMRGLADESVPSNHLTDDSGELQEIQLRVAGLCGKNDRFPTDFEDRSKSENIYLYLIPRLTAFLADIAEIYLEVDQDEATADCSVTVDHLRILARITQLIVQIGWSAKRQYVRPNREYPIIKPVHDKLVVPLRIVDKMFREHLNHSDEQRAATARRAQWQAQQVERCRIEELQAAQKAEERKLRRKWRYLHQERQRAELNPILPASKERHLRYVDHQDEIDGNGDTFEREEVFRPRIGPPPALVCEARRVPWTDEEVAALCDGLRRYAGERVFEDIFENYCVNRGLLGRFSVTEIVTIAADAKDWYSRTQMQETGTVEEWVRTIPQWTKPHVMLHVDKENNHEGEEDGRS